MKEITIVQLLEKLNYKDLRAVRKWCSDHNVLIAKQGKSEFVYESNFKEEFERPFISMLKNKFGKEWESVYRLYSEGNIPALNEINDLSEKSYPIYKSESSSNKFLKTLNDYEHKKKNAAEKGRIQRTISVL